MKSLKRGLAEFTLQIGDFLVQNHMKGTNVNGLFSEAPKESSTIKLTTVPA